MNGVKTGHTLQAGYVLIGSGTQHGMTLIAPVLGTPDETVRDRSTLGLLEWGFATFRLVHPVVAGRILARPTVRDRAGVRAAVIAGATFERVLRRADRVRLRVQVPAQLAGPLPRRAVVGRVVVLAGGRPVGAVPLVLAHALPAVSSLTVAAAFLTRPFSLLLLVVLVAGAVGASVVWRQRNRELAAGTRT
jgi:D-alanyl-D-alanine carboxypeptidase (penicillin-binding protein 5/6)